MKPSHVSNGWNGCKQILCIMWENMIKIMPVSSLRGQIWKLYLLQGFPVSLQSDLQFSVIRYQVSDLSGCLQAGWAAPWSHTSSVATLAQLDKPIQAAFFLCQKGTRIALMHAIDNASRLLTNCKSTSYNGLSDSKIGFGVISVIWSFFKY